MALSTLSHQSFIEFLEHLEVERNLSKLTIRNYSHYLSRFIDWLSAQGINDLKNINQDHIRKYRLFLSRIEDESGQTLSVKTQSYHIIALRSWLKYLVKNDLAVLHPEKIDLPKAEAHSMKFLTAEKILELLNQPDVATKKGLRDRALMETLFSTGLRVSELVSINRDQLDLKRQEFGVIGKGRKPRVVFLSDRACIWLGRWLDLRLGDKWDPVFIRISGKKFDPNSDGEEMRLTTRSVQRIVDKYSRLARLPIKLTPHAIRHSFATDMLSNGAGLRDIQEMLGHKNIATTQIYTHVTRPELKEVHKKFHSKV